MRDQVWIGILEANRLTRYYSALADQLRWRQRLLSVVIAVAASGAAATVLAQWPAWLSAIVLFGTFVCRDLVSLRRLLWESGQGRFGMQPIPRT